MIEKKSLTAVVFPGQGSQSVGMVSDIYDKYSVVRDLYTEASDILGFDLWGLTLNGPVSELNKTVNTQPAVLAAGVSCWLALQEQTDFSPDFFAGHSLGEYTALVVAGRLSFADAICLAKRRAEFMQDAVPEGFGAMAAILGLGIDDINKVCEDISTTDSMAWSANDNAPGQTVIAGHKSAVESACNELKSIGAKRALILPVSVPSHCPLMQPAADKMRELLVSINWSSTDNCLIHNSDVSSHQEIDDIVNVLSDQLIKPVRWVETIRFFINNGVENIIEVGPGKVLTGLNKRIAKTANAKSVFDVSSLKDALGFVNNL